MPTQKSNTKVVTGIVRLSYEHVWEPASINGSNPKYSVSLIIPKSDTKTIAATKGRASYLGERSIGHQDPGATSITMVLEIAAGEV